MPKKKINGIEFYYERHGKGPPLILICGFMNHLRMWEHFIFRLKNSFEVIVFDNRGAGRTDASPPPYTIDGLADDVIALMDALKIDRAHMVGFSMGCAIIQSIGLRHGKRIHKGALIAPFNALPSTAKMQAASIGKLFEAGVEPALALETLLPWIYSNDYLSDPKNIEKAIKDMIESPYPQTPQGYFGQQQAILNFDLTDRLEEIETDMLILAGEEDLYTPLYTVHILNEKLPNNTLKIVPKMGHMLHIEAEELTTKEIHAYCKS